MNRLLPLLQPHWLTIALLVAAAVLAVRAALRGRVGVSGWLAFALALFAGGMIGLHGWKYQLVEDGDTRTIAVAVVALTAVVFALAALLLLLARVWSFTLGLILGAVLLAGIGGWVGRDISSGVAYAGRSALYLDFIRPWWLVLLVFVPAVFLMSRGSLSGLGPWRKWMAVGGRAGVVAAIALALAEPRLLRPSENVTVLFLVDRSFSVPQEPGTDAKGNPLDLRWERTRALVEQSVNLQFGRSRDDKFGVMLFGKRPKLLLPPAPVFATPLDPNAAGPVDGEYTDIAAAFKLALASFPEGTGKRIVLVSDGNPNRGLLAEQLDLAVKNKVEVDTVALAPGVRNENEVRVESVDAPALTAEGERRTLRVVVRNEHPTRIVDGTLELLRIGAAVGDQPAEKRDPVRIVETDQVLDAGKRPPIVRLMPSKVRQNVFEFVDTPGKGRSSYTYTATFTPIRSKEPDAADWTPGLAGDRPANNAASTVVVAKGKQKMLFLDPKNFKETDSPHRHLVSTLRKANFQLDYLSITQLPKKKDQLAVFLLDYDCVVLANVPADDFEPDHMEVIRQQVHDQGCGLVMVGGPDSFGPGGYQGTPVEAALPVDCEVKAKKAAGKGGLILIMHASEMADGNKWQKDIAKLAVQRLGAGDMIGVLDYGFGVGGGVNWPIKFQEVGDDKGRHYKEIDRMTPGDMPDFDPFLKAAADTLSDPQYNLAVKHVILISDGDPQFSPLGAAAVQLMADNNITCTTIGVATHGVNEDTKMQKIASGTKDGSGKPGNFHKVTNPNQLPAIYIRETRKISQSFIYDKEFDPQLLLRDGPTVTLNPPLPKLKGMVRTTKKENVLADMLVEGPADPQSGQRFPVLAKWRYGLGKSVAFTSDARSQPSGVSGWDREWVSSDIYQKFWTDTIRWAMRDEEKGQLVVATETRNGRVQVTVTAQKTDPRDNKKKPVSGLSLQGMVSLPNPPLPGQPPPKLDFKPKAGSPGQYVAEFSADDAGSYFVTVNASEPKIGSNGKQERDTKGPVYQAFDSARTGTTVPYSPEYADLETDTGRMKQIAEACGGKYHEEPATLADALTLAAAADFFRRSKQGSESQLPFWYWLVFATGVLLLFDVGVRRISFEWAETRQALATQWRRLRATEYVEVPDEGSMIGALGRVKKRTTDTEAKKRATRRFEPGDADVVAPAGADEFGTGGVGKPPPPPPSGKPAPKPDEDGDDFMTRMKKARDRGRRGPE